MKSQILPFNASIWNFWNCREVLLVSPARAATPPRVFPEEERGYEGPCLALLGIAVQSVRSVLRPAEVGRVSVNRRVGLHSWRSTALIAHPYRCDVAVSGRKRPGVRFARAFPVARNGS